jgi:hypothetical protein
MSDVSASGIPVSSETIHKPVMPGCERQISCAPLLMYFYVHCAAVLANPPFSPQPDRFMDDLSGACAQCMTILDVCHIKKCEKDIFSH